MDCLHDLLLSIRTEDDAKNMIINMRWPDGVRCIYPDCNHDKVYTLKGANKRFKCAACRKQFTATQGTIFHNSAIPLKKWLAAIYILVSTATKVSSHQLANELQITQKSAWYVKMEIMTALLS